MIEYKYIMDALGSTASFVAIVAVLVSWFKIAQKPLVIDRVIIHKKENESTYILIVKNRKPYPVEIKSTRCYTKRRYRVTQKTNQKPEYAAQLNLKDSPFENFDEFEIGANGHTDVRIIGQNINGEILKLLFSINTSHGYHELWSKNIDIVNVNMGDSMEVYTLEHKHEYDSKFKAKTKYYWLYILSFFKKKS